MKKFQAPPPLILNALPSVAPANSRTEIPLHELHPNPFNSRGDDDYDLNEILELAESIKVNSLWHPIVVTERAGRWIVVDGWSRKLAYEQLSAKAESKDAFTKIPVQIKNGLSDLELHSGSFVTNELHNKLSDYDKAQAFAKGLEKGLYESQEALATRLGVESSTVSRLLVLTKLPTELSRYVRTHKRALSYGIVSHVLRLPSEQVVTDGLRILNEYVDGKKNREWVKSSVDKLLSGAKRVKNEDRRVTPLGTISLSSSSKGKSLSATFKSRSDMQQSAALLENFLNLPDEARATVLELIAQKIRGEKRE